MTEPTVAFLNTANAPNKKEAIILTKKKFALNTIRIPRNRPIIWWLRNCTFSNEQ